MEETTEGMQAGWPSVAVNAAVLTQCCRAEEQSCVVCMAEQTATRH